MVVDAFAWEQEATYAMVAVTKKFELAYFKEEDVGRMEAELINRSKGENVNR